MYQYFKMSYFPDSFWFQGVWEKQFLNIGKLEYNFWLLTLNHRIVELEIILVVVEPNIFNFQEMESKFSRVKSSIVWLLLSGRVRTKCSDACLQIPSTVLSVLRTIKETN